MVTTIEMRQLRDVHKAIRNSVRELAYEVAVDRILDDGTCVTHMCPSLVDQLIECVTNKRDDRDGGSGRRRAMPMCVEAFDLLNAVMKEFGSVEAIRAMPGTVAAWTDLVALRDVHYRLTYTADMIRAVIDPPKRYHIASACPACSSRMAIRLDAAGDYVQVPALAVNGVDGCTCLACGSVWPPNRLEHLALVLGLEPLDT